MLDPYLCLSPYPRLTPKDRRHALSPPPPRRGGGNHWHLGAAGLPAVHAALALGSGGGGLRDQFLPAGADARLHAGGRGLCAVVGPGDRADRADRVCRLRSASGSARRDRHGDDPGRDRGDPPLLESLAPLRGEVVFMRGQPPFSPSRAGA